MRNKGRSRGGRNIVLLVAGSWLLVSVIAFVLEKNSVAVQSSAVVLLEVGAGIAVAGSLLFFVARNGKRQMQKTILRRSGER
ncbi:hypothetical protein D6783_05410 [Candidatus Woesearchaeota archaeon]|nr:MAG: hypothetical protein D6783_05410 [Candidatus Woesearchaeota archaeon]